MLQLELYDAKMAEGGWTDHDARTFGGLTNAVRLMLRELGIKAAPAKRKNPLVEHFSRPPKEAAE
jgi:hypothetical protein